MPDTPRTKRKSYTIKQKLDIVREFQKNPDTVKSEFLKKHNIGRRTLAVWIKSLPEFQKALVNRNVSITKMRRLPSTGRRAYFQEVEDQLYAWIKEENRNDRHVKDREAQQKALELYHIYKLSNPFKEIPPFKAASGWLDKFKKRYKINSQTQLLKKGGSKPRV